ncbi:MAG: DUF2225 domain-containing protein [Lachnospiraceae bacterium]|nr:DUF2225 domain-containing protein [Lachnospiraceae bacterium]
MGLLSGLGGFGLDGLEGMKLYEDPSKESNAAKEGTSGENGTPEANKVSEADFIFEKSYTCPACDKEFKNLSVKANRARLKEIDTDLRPVYEQIEPLKYDVVMCPHCGCAAIGRYWNGLTDNQRKLIKANISAKFTPKQRKGELYSYDEALERYQVALANAMVKRVKASEKAYICLRAGWLLRSKAESLDSSVAGYADELKKAKDMEDEFLQNALEGFITARESELFPICGMDEMTVDYLIAALSVRFGKYDQASKLVGSLLTNRNLSARMKDKTLQLKEAIVNAKSGK